MRWLIVVGTLVALSSCGGDGKGPGNPDAYQGKDAGGDGNECSQRFIDEYNQVAFAAQALQADQFASEAQTRSDATNLRDLATAFRAKYENVECVALLNGDKAMINVNQRMDLAINAANEALSQAGNADHAPPQGHVQPSPSPSPSASPKPVPSASASPIPAPSASPSPVPPGGYADCTNVYLSDYDQLIKDEGTFDSLVNSIADPNVLFADPAVHAAAQTLNTDAKEFKKDYAGVICWGGVGNFGQLMNQNGEVDSDVTYDITISNAILNGGNAKAQNADVLRGFSMPKIELLDDLHL
jgi:hypothetical protein